MLNSPEYNQQREHIIKLQTSLITSGQLPTCTNCEHFKSEDGLTGEMCWKFGARPPAETIVVGCVYHMATIPF